MIYFIIKIIVARPLLSMKHITRLYIDFIDAEKPFFLSSNQANHVARVMRKNIGDIIHIFNASQGEYECIITEIKSMYVKVQATKQILDSQHDKRKSAIAFGIIDQTRCKWLVEKATELDVCDIIPLCTKYSDKQLTWKRDKMQKVAIQASEQCERLDIPNIYDPITLEDLFNSDIFAQYTKLACIERDMSRACICNTSFLYDTPYVFIVGPSGGFHQDETSFLIDKSNYTISIGGNIQRTETACISCLSYGYYKSLILEQKK